MTRTSNNYGRFIDLPGAVADWRPKVEAILKEHGFGVLTEIDVKATLKEKLGEDVPAQFILGACNPPLAHAAMTAEPDIGLLLPCNITLRELEGGLTRVGVIDVNGMMGMVGNADLPPIGDEVSARFERFLSALDDGA